MNKRIALLVLLLIVTMENGCGKNKNNPQQIATTAATVTMEQETTDYTEDGLQEPAESIKSDEMPTIPVETTPLRPTGTTPPSASSEPAESISPGTSPSSESASPPADSFVNDIGENQTPPRK